MNSYPPPPFSEIGNYKTASVNTSLPLKKMWFGKCLEFFCKQLAISIHFFEALHFCYTYKKSKMYGKILKYSAAPLWIIFFHIIPSLTQLKLERTVLLKQQLWILWRFLKLGVRFLYFNGLKLFMDLHRISFKSNRETLATLQIISWKSREVSVNGKK